MTELVTSAEMRAIELDAITSGKVTGLGLMEIAGQGVVDAIIGWRPELADASHSAPRSAMVLCGPGNNGGDGYVVARLLAERGWVVQVHGMGEAASMPKDAQSNRLRWEAMGQVWPLTERHVRFDVRFDDTGAPKDPQQADIIVDAIFGTGLKRAPAGDLLSLLTQLGTCEADPSYRHPGMVAIDAPSGLDLDSGRMLAGGLPMLPYATVPICGLTVTFEVPKLGHFLADGPACCGKLAVVDLGLLYWRGIRRGIRRGAVTGDSGLRGQGPPPRVQLVDQVPIVE
ncbi:MAG: NAD(P)H-hydrate epimerase, partial [Roseicyclus sp.]|nr:NAD(P)H-hydrate epimerase [Roseicyclus sp.]